MNEWQSNTLFFQLDFSRNSHLMDFEMGNIAINKDKKNACIIQSQIYFKNHLAVISVSVY